MKIFNKEYVKNRFVYTWPIFFVTLICLPFLWSWAFSMYHEPLPFQKVSAFVSCYCETGPIEKLVMNNIEDENLKSFELNQCAYEEMLFNQKLSVVGVNYSDILILNRSAFELMNYSETFIPLTNDILTSFFASESDFIIKDEVKYGISMKNSWLNDEITKSSEDYYLFINKISSSVGEINGEEEKDHISTFVVSQLLLKEKL